MYVRVGRIRTLHWLSKINWNSNLEEKVKKKIARNLRGIMDVQMSQKGCPKVPWALKSILLGNMPTFLQHSNALNRKLETSNFYFFKCMTFLVLK